MPISDLTGTKWLLNSSLDLSIKTAYELNFVSNDTNYIYFAISKSPNPKEPIAYSLTYYTTYYNSRTVYSAYGGDWVDEVYRTIEITGGTDATNADLIAWLQVNATQIAEPEITDLTGTTWLIDDTLQVPDEAFNLPCNDLIFTSNNESYGGLLINRNIRYNVFMIQYGGDLVYDYNNYSGQGIGWVFQTYRTITITGGTDATNADLIAWLQSNAVQQVEPLTQNGIFIGAKAMHKAFIGEFGIDKMYIAQTLV